MKTNSTILNYFASGQHDKLTKSLKNESNEDFCQVTHLYFMKGLFQQINKNLTFAYNLALIVINIAYSIYVHLFLPIGIKKML